MNPFANIGFPGQAISPNPTLETRLLSGEVWQVPQGNWLVRLGFQSAAQFFDYYSGLWRTFDSGPTNSPTYIPSDGQNYRVINLSGTITGGNITVAGTAYTQANTTLSFQAPVSGGITATASPIIGGSLTFTVTGGTGYTNPMLIIPPPQLLGGTPGLCIPAVASIGLAAGALSTITARFAGAGYVTAPGSNTVTLTPDQLGDIGNPFLTSTNMVLVDPAGTGGTVTATIANGTSTSGGLTGIIMSNNGSLYDGTHIPTITVTSATGSSAAATALPCMSVTDLTIGSTNTGYTASVIVETSLGSGTAISGIAGDTVHPRPGRAVIPQSGGILASPVIEDAGAGFQTVPLAKQVGNATADGSVNATFVAVVGGVTNTLIAWQLG